MLTYAQIESNRRKCLALTGLTPKEFQLVLLAFERAYGRCYPRTKTLAGSDRQRQAGGGRKGKLDSVEQKLLFALVYLKTYPLQALLGEVFGLSQPRANIWVHRLLPVLQQALKRMGVRPERDPHQVSRRVRQSGEPLDLIIDGTERRRQRPKNKAIRDEFYSKHKHAHTDKNLVLSQRQSRQIAFLSQTYRGRVHDKKMADTERIRYPRGAREWQDTGFQGYAPRGVETLQPKKSPRNGQLKPGEKRHNRHLARTRVRVEHSLAGVKRARVLKETLRNYKENFSDLAMELGCSLHNLRVRERKRHLRKL